MVNNLLKYTCEINEILCSKSEVKIGDEFKYEIHLLLLLRSIENYEG